MPSPLKRADFKDEKAYRAALDAAALADEKEGLRQGREDIAAGRTRPVKEVFDEMRARYRIPRQG